MLACEYGVPLEGTSTDASDRLPEPHPAAIALVNTVMSVRRLVVRYLMLPRLLPVKRLEDHPDKVTGRFNLSAAQGNYPYYVKPTLWKQNL